MTTEHDLGKESVGKGKVAVVTGASAGIGAATVVALAQAGYTVFGGARRREPLEKICGAVGAFAHVLDVADAESVARFAAWLEEKAGALHVLVNNAGFAAGVDAVSQADVDAWRSMYETNVLGVVRLTQVLLPRLEASGDGHVINVGSIAGFETYPGGGGYTATKHALRAATRTLRIELLGRPVRVTEICPGMVETEFSVVRLGDEEKADAVYQGMQPLVAQDIAETIRWCSTRPSHVNIDEIVVRPRDQATATAVYRREQD
ncbi:MAG: SDR family NAD(P)-dependent oxidoreductase [Acidobacteriota bacterium]